jgi:hypothetical protein
MGIDFSSIDAAFGFQPYGNVLRANLYAVNTAPTINIYHNDIVRHGGTGVSTPVGYLPIIEDGAVPDSGTHILGTVLEIFDEDMMPAKRILATAAGNGTIAGYVLVADHPDQLLIAQEDGVGNAIDLAEIGQNIDLISVALCAGNANTGISTQELDSSTAGVAAALQFRIVKPHEDDTPDVDATPNSRWIVAINEHFFNSTDSAGI